MFSTNALSLLSVYSSDSEDDVPASRVSVKRCNKDEIEKPNKFIKKDISSKIPLPELFRTKQEENSEQNVDKLGRIRNFPHERGNWSTYVYIPYEYNTVIEELINSIISQCESSITLLPIQDLHISLTKTVVLRHHWIDSFIKIISDNISHIGGFVLFFDNLEVYCNEERTRTFLGLRIKSGIDTLVYIVNALDKGLTQFNLPIFYENPSFHMSLAWCTGDQEEVLNSFMDTFNETLAQLMNIHIQSIWYIHVKKLVCKTGNKMYDLNLSQHCNIKK